MIASDSRSAEVTIPAAGFSRTSNDPCCASATIRSPARRAAAVASRRIASKSAIRLSSQTIRTANATLAVLLAASAKLGLHLYAGRHYGYFVDELYYLACARHLDWGYVDHPPLIAILTRFWTAIFGQSLAAIRLLPALAGAAEVWLAAQLARELGGGRFAQIFAAIATLAAPAILGGNNILTINACEPRIWMGCAWVV